MEWDKEAASELIRLPLAKIARENTKVFAEKLARKRNGNRVTLRDITDARKVAYGSVSEEARQAEIDKRIAAGEKDLRERLADEGRDILGREINLFRIVTCAGETSRCRSRIIELGELKKELEQKLRELKVTEIIADIHRDNERITAINRITLAISGCPIGCGAPEAKSFGVHGICQPVITDKTCSECYACLDACPKGAIVIKNGEPKINAAHCDLCVACAGACTTGKLVRGKIGYRIMVGGRLGQFHKQAVQLFRNTDKATLFAAVEAAVGTIKEEAIGYEDLYSIVNRVGIAPIFQRIYRR